MDAEALTALSPEQKAERWQALEARALGCTRCVLHKGRTKVVFGEGHRAARLVFVGEGPGEQEDLSGRPFVGKAGQLLDKIIGAMGLQREDVYICNVVKCRPPGNRTPLPDEVALCNPYLEEQLALIAPKAIVALGSPASKALLKTSQGIMALRGRWQLYRGIRVMPTYHPAFVLRQYTDEVRRAVWNDMKQVSAYLQEG
ncbi:MAG: uracil-DNA glycosylase [Planctomycetota bacterium]|nr:uracil-DNA glycosylase [Planctomycetota bacterium]